MEGKTKAKSETTNETSNDIDLDKVFREHLKSIMKYLHNKTNDKPLAEDLAQETFYKATKKIDSFKGECDVLIWLRRIAKNVWIDYIRRKKNVEVEMLSEEIAMEFDILEDYVQKEKNKEMYKELDGLPDEIKRLMLMRGMDDMFFKAIGDLLGRTEEWARITFKRTKKKIKEKNREEEK